MRLHDYAPRPARIKWLFDSDPAIRWQVMSDLTMRLPTRLQPSGRASPPKAGSPTSRRQSPAGYWGDPRKWDLVTLNSLVALKDLGLDPPAKQARKMIDRIDKRLC